MIQSFIRGVLFLGSLLLTFVGLFYAGRREGKKQVEQDWTIKRREAEIEADFKREIIENEVNNSDLSKLVADDNAKHSSGNTNK